MVCLNLCFDVCFYKGGFSVERIEKGVNVVESWLDVKVMLHWIIMHFYSDVWMMKKYWLILSFFNICLNCGVFGVWRIKENDILVKRWLNIKVMLHWIIMTPT